MRDEVDKSSDEVDIDIELSQAMKLILILILKISILDLINTYLFDEVESVG